MGPSGLRRAGCKIRAAPLRYEPVVFEGTGSSTLLASVDGLTKPGMDITRRRKLAGCSAIPQIAS